MQISQIKTPALILDLNVFEKNLEDMQRFSEKVGIALRPHYKTHKCTAIAHRQIQMGAKGLCCAKVSEAEDLILAGIEDILIANQIVDSGKIAKIADLARCCRLTVCVDHEDNIEQLEKAAALMGSRIYCLVEYDIGMVRCGVRDREDFLRLARRIKETEHLEFEGAQAYAGHIAHLADYEKRKEISEKIEAELIVLKEYVEKAGIPLKEVSGVSAGTALLRKADSIYTEIQAGSYIFMDTSYQALGLRFENALSVLTSVISVQGGKIVADAGLKTLGVDQRLPVFASFPDRDINFSEEHCTISGEEGECGTGDKLRILPGHCCTTVNLFDHMYFVRDGKVEDRVPVTSRGKSL